MCVRVCVRARVCVGGEGEFRSACGFHFTKDRRKEEEEEEIEVVHIVWETGRHRLLVTSSGCHGLHAAAVLCSGMECFLLFIYKGYI